MGVEFGLRVEVVAALGAHLLASRRDGLGERMTHCDERGAMPEEGAPWK